MVESHESSDPKPLYAGRLLLADESTLISTGSAEAVDQLTNQTVIVAIEAKSEGRVLSQLASASHAHLNPVIEVIERSDDWLVLSRAVSAKRLSGQVAEHGRKQPVEAVRMALRVADALTQLHDMGLSHGRVHPDNVLVGLTDSVDPSLLFGTKSPTAYILPERRSSGEPPDARDDTWAATALLYFMLTAFAPPFDGLQSVADLDAFAIEDTLLREVLFHGLAKDREKRARTLFALKRELARWFIAHAADEPMPQSTLMSHKPPPLPPSMAPSPRASVGIVGGSPSEMHLPASVQPGSALPPPKPVWLRSVPLTIGAAVLGIVVAWGISTLRKGEQTVVLKNRFVPGANGVAATASGPIDLAEVPVTGKEQESGDATASCVKGYLRDGTLVKTAQLDPICKESELPRSLGLLRMAFASTVGTAPTSAARFDALGWYSLPTLAGLRQACCGDNPPALKLPDLGDACSDFVPALEGLARAIGSTQSIEAAIRRFDEAAKCATKSGRAIGISASPPGPVSEKAFRDAFNTVQTATDNAGASGTSSPATAASAPSAAPTSRAP